MSHYMSPYSDSPYPMHMDTISLNDDRIFHYTTAESFLTIIRSKTIRTSRLPDLNDLNEIDPASFFRINNIQEGVKVKELLEHNYSVASFSQNYEVKFRNGEAKLIWGCCNPPMWAHYGDNIKGVCLCLSKKALDQENPGVIIKPVNCDIDTSDYPSEDITAEEFIKKHSDKLFFHKQPSWIYEHEVRARVYNEIPDLRRPLSIANSVREIVFSPHFIKHHFEEFIFYVSTQDTACKINPIYWHTIMRNHIEYGLHMFVEKDTNDILMKYKKSIESYLEFINSENL